MQLFTGDVVWADFGDGRGREQMGIRPAIVVASPEYLGLVDSLALVVPTTTRHRGWPNHVPISGMTGLSSDCWAMTEQLRSISRERILRWSGTVDDATFRAIRVYLADALAF